MKIVLAYSGGLDTSVMLKWLKEEYKAELIAMVVDVGQGLNEKQLREKALATGASKVYIEDAKEEFVREYIFPALQADAIYEGKYLLSTALSRPLIAKKLVEMAKREEADAVAHGCTGKGNDQVRFEVAISTLHPNLLILAPHRDWNLRTREQEIEYARKHNIPVEVSGESPYSIDWNLWGVSIECGVLENVALEPPEDAYQITTSPLQAPDDPAEVEIRFEEGIPISLNGKSYSSPVELIGELNKIGGENGVGRVDSIENRLVGIKSREIYEAPAATILFHAHRELESLVLDRDCYHFKELISHKYSELVYYGLWYSPLKDALDSFIKETQKRVTGIVRMKLFKGSVFVIGRESKYSLYDEKLATYGKDDIFDHKSAEGFIKIWGLPYKGTKSNL
jgi:argininosuccinate synthase